MIGGTEWLLARTGVQQTPRPPRTPGPLKHSLRSTFATLLAALAIACAGLGARGVALADGPREPVLRQGYGTNADVQRTLELAFLRGGAPSLAARTLRPGAMPRVVPGTHASVIPLAATYGARGSFAGPLLLPTLNPPFARRLAAARDGTLSARSNGVPPPPIA